MDILSPILFATESPPPYIMRLSVDVKAVHRRKFENSLGGDIKGLDRARRGSSSCLYEERHIIWSASKE